MFNNRQTRRRFQLGNLARLLQLRQSVSHQSPPQLQPATTLPLPEPKSSLPLPLSPKSKEESQSQPKPPPSPPESGESQPQPLTLMIGRFQSSTPSQVWPPSLSESGESKSPLPPPEAKIPMTPRLTLDASGESQPQQPPPARPIDENRSLSPPISSADSVPPSKSIEEHKSTPPLPDSKSLTHSSPPPSPLLSPKPSENLQSQSRKLPQSPTALRSPSPQKYSPMKAPISSRSASPATNTAPPSSPPKSPPSISSPHKSQKIPSPKPSLPQIEPNPIKYHSTKPRNTESHTSPDHNKGENENLETEITGKMNKNKENPVAVMMMFVNSNVQGIVSSLSLDSSSIDHEPGVHLTIDQTCDFSSTLF